MWGSVEQTQGTRIILYYTKLLLVNDPIQKTYNIRYQLAKKVSFFIKGYIVKDLPIFGNGSYFPTWSELGTNF